MAKNKVLFLCRVSDYNFQYGGAKPTGLRNSALFCAQALASHGIPAYMEVVNDGNDVDREVSRYQPTHVVIEALWVTPAKLTELINLHPLVTWIVRLHSEMPFLSYEGIAMEWLMEYSRLRNVYVSSNSRRLCEELHTVLGRGARLLHLPNCYQITPTQGYQRSDGAIHIGCFGAIRPMKNQLLQAVAAIAFANSIGRILVFHMNGDRIEGGTPAKRNLIALFDNSRHTLKFHPWMEHNEFLCLLSTLDIGMQLSLSETFNIVAADCVVAGLPIVVSGEVHWASVMSKATPTDSAGIVRALGLVWRHRWLNTVLNLRVLKAQCRKAERIWINYFE